MRKCMVRSPCDLVVVGDVDAKVLAVELFQAFSGWNGGSAQPPAARAEAVKAMREGVQMPDKTNVTLILGSGHPTA